MKGHLRSPPECLLEGPRAPFVWTTSLPPERRGVISRPLHGRSREEEPPVPHAWARASPPRLPPDEVVVSAETQENEWWWQCYHPSLDFFLDLWEGPTEPLLARASEPFTVGRTSMLQRPFLSAARCRYLSRTLAPTTEVKYSYP